MRIIIVGAGFTGIQLAKLLVNEKNAVTIIDNDLETLNHVGNQVDCTTVCADGNNLETLEDAGIANTDALVCVTSDDEVNMITCSLVDAVYPDVLKIARVRNYAYYTNRRNAEKKHSNDFTGKHRPLYGINYMINPDVEAADAIVQAVENGAVGNVLTFDNSELEIASIIVEKGSIFDGIALKDIRSKTDKTLLVSYIEKDGVTSLPSGNTIIEAGNNVGILLSKHDLSEAMELCGSKRKQIQKIALIGAGRIGTRVAEQLISSNRSTISKVFSAFKTKRTQDFVIIDSNPELTNAASERFSEARVMCADASDAAFLNEEGITSFDLAICATHNHEMNMILAAYLESLGVGQTISLVKSSDFKDVAAKLGIDVPIALRDAVVDSIMSHLRGKSVKEIHTVNDGKLEIVECEVSSESKAAGKALKDIADPGMFLVLLNKKAGVEEYQIANGNTTLLSGDHVVLITNSENSKKVLSFFVASE